MYKYLLIGCAVVGGIGFLLYKLYRAQQRIQELEEAHRDLSEKARLFKEIQSEHFYPHPPFPQPVVMDHVSMPHTSQAVQEAAPMQDAGQGGLAAPLNAVSSMIQQFAGGTGLSALFEMFPGAGGGAGEESLLMTVEQRTVAPSAEPIREASEEDVNRAVDQFLNNESETGASATTPVQPIRIVRRRTPLRISPVQRSSPQPVQEAVQEAVQDLSPVVMQKVEQVDEEKPMLTQSGLADMGVDQMREVAKRLGVSIYAPKESGRPPRKKRKEELLHELSAYCNPHEELNIVS